jgi:hypothetical protein
MAALVSGAESLAPRVVADEPKSFFFSVADRELPQMPKPSFLLVHCL